MEEVITGAPVDPALAATEALAVEPSDVAAKLSSMFDMTPLTSVIGTLLAALNDQKKAISSLTAMLRAAEAKTDSINKHVSSIEGEAAAAKELARAEMAALNERISALESKGGYLQSKPEDSADTKASSDEIQWMISEQMEVARQNLDGSLLQHFQEYKDSLPDYNSLCDTRIKLYFGSSEILKDFTKKIAMAHSAVEAVPRLEGQTHELRDRVDALSAVVKPQGDQLGAMIAAADRKAQKALDVVLQLNQKAEEEERLRLRVRASKANIASDSPTSATETAPRPSRGVSVASQHKSVGLVKVSAPQNEPTDEPPADVPPGDVPDAADEAPQPVVIDQEGDELDTWEPPISARKLSSSIIADSVVGTLIPEPEPEKARQTEEEDILDLVEEVKQVVEESIEECFDELSFAEELDDSPNFPEQSELKRIPQYPVAKAVSAAVVTAHTRDITKLEKPSSFQYSRPVMLEEPVLMSESNALESRPQSGPKSSREDSRQLSARRKQMLKETLNTRMNSMDIPALVERGEKHVERVKQDPANSLASRLRIVEEILAKLPGTLSTSMDTLRHEITRGGVVTLGAAGPNVRNELIQIMQVTESVRKKVANLESKLDGVIQASLDGQALNANVRPEEDPETVLPPIIQYVKAEPAVVIPAGPSIEEITAQMRSVAADAMRDLVTHKQCHDMILAALDKPRGQYAAASDVTGLLEWKKTACGALEHLEVEKANKGDLTGSLSGLKTDLVMQLGHVNDDVKQMVVAMKHNETEALMRLHAKMDSLTSYVDKIDLEIAAHLRPVVNDSMRRKGHVGGVSDDRNTDLESKMARFEKKSQQIHSLQMDQIARLVDSLQSVESELRHRPKEGQIQAMVHMIEEEFKKLLGSNVGDIQQTIQRIVNAIHSKAGKGEVVKLISSSIAHVQLDISKINQGEVPAGGYKCLSCGHNGATVRLMTGSPHPHEDPVMSRSAPDDASVGSAMSLLSDPSTAAVINRTAGLRPLGGFHEPQDPKVAAIAEKKRNAQAHMHRSRPTTSQEPLYRRARLAAQLKEIPKVTPVDLGHLPQYAMDDEDISVGSLASFESLSFHSPKKGDLHSRSVSSEILKLPQVHSSPAFSKSSVLGETERT